MTCIKMGSDESHFNVSLIVRDKVTRPCPQTTTFDEKGEPKLYQTEVLPLMDAPHNVRDAPNDITDAPHNVMDAPNNIMGAPPNNRNAPLNVMTALLQGVKELSSYVGADFCFESSRKRPESESVHKSPVSFSFSICVEVSCLTVQLTAQCYLCSRMLRLCN